MTVLQGFIQQPHINIPGRGATFGTVPLAERFWAKVKIADGCWEWRGSLNRGRGVIAIDGQPQFAARVSWEMHNGPIPRSLKVCHHCDNPKCVRPEHLFLGTQRDNIQDARAKGRLKINRTYRPDKSATAKLSWKIVREIRTNTIDTLVVLAARYGVCIAAVGNVKNGKTWKE